MRIFKTSCKDDKTGKEILLSECSYNMAMEWLFQKIHDAGMEVCRQFTNATTGLYEVWTAKWSDNICNYVPTRHFYYDEERGYLLGD